MAKAKRAKAKGAAGNFRLNQHAPKFQHKNSKRLNTRAARFSAEMRLDSAI